MASYIDSECQAFLDSGVTAGGPPSYKLSFRETRAALEDMQKHTPTSYVTAKELTLPVRLCQRLFSKLQASLAIFHLHDTHMEV